MPRATYIWGILFTLYAVALIWSISNTDPRPFEKHDYEEQSFESNGGTMQIEPPNCECDTKLNKPAFIPRLKIKSQYFVINSPTNPSFLILNDKNEFPIVDGDVSQQKVLEYIKLKERCTEYPDTIVVDIGGFLGDFGIYAGRLGCKVYIFEPSPYQYWLIKSSVELNGLTRNVKVYNYAVSENETTVAFKDKGGSTNQIPTVTESQAMIDKDIFFVKTTTLDSILPIEDIFLLKVDVEGFEPTVLLKGCKKMLSERRVKHIISEYTAWWNTHGKGPWSEFMNNMLNFDSNTIQMYALHREGPHVYGPIPKSDFGRFWKFHEATTLQTDLYFDMHGEGLIKSNGPWTEQTYA